MSAIKLFSNLSLRLKLVLISALVEIIMLGLLVSNSMRLMNNTIEYHAETLIEDVSPLLDGALSLYMFERDHASMQEILDKLIKQGKSDLRYIVVLDETGKIYAGAGWPLDKQLPAADINIESAIQDKMYDSFTTLTLGELKVGEVRFGITLEKMIEARADLLNQGLLIASSEILLTIFLLSLAGYLLTRHIFLLVNATHKVAAGDYSSSVEKSSNDEIGQLADNFNTMTLAIRNRVEALKNSERALTEEKERILVTLNSIGDGVITTDLQGNIELLNPIAEQLTGWTHAQAEGRPLESVFNIVDELFRQPLDSPVTKCIAPNKAAGEINEIASNTVLIRRNGDEFAIENNAAPIRNSSGNIIGIVIVFHDVSKSRQMVQQLAYQARHDTLTGLYNRSVFDAKIEAAIHTAKTENRSHVVLYMDLDQFKIVNDTCGHFAGDELLKQLSAMLQNKTRGTDTLARLGGDEFGVLLINCNLQQADSIAETLRKKIKDFYFEWEDRQFDITVSIGGVPITAESHSLAEVLSAADVACYIAKEKGRNRVHLHVADDEEQANRQRELLLASDISSAIDENRFALYFQMIKSTNSDAATHHHELLIRMIDKNGKFISPLTFISAAERFYLMPQVDQWVVCETLNFLNKNKLALKNKIFAINLSGQSVSSNEFISFMLKQINNSAVEAKQLCFEITETAAIANLQNASFLISELKKLGCTFSLDDFGSGLSSFAYLKNLNVDYLKIDGSFIKDVLKDPANAAMIEAINQVGHIMGLKTIAEYVENGAIHQAVTRIGIDFVQGFTIHKPEPLKNLLLKSQ